MARYSKKRGNSRRGGFKSRIRAGTRSRRVAGRRRSMRSSRGRSGGANRTVRLVIETQPTSPAIRTEHGFAVAAPAVQKNPIF